MRFTEEEIRQGDFRCTETVVTPAGEIDIYRAGNVPGIEIRIGLARDDDSTLSYSSTLVVGDDGRQVGIADEEGEWMDREAVDVMAYELIEYTDTAVDYMTGRAACVAEDGVVLTAGQRRAWPAEDAIEMAPA